jgi:hypothetical protein
MLCLLAYYPAEGVFTWIRFKACCHAEAPWIVASAYTFVLCLLAYYHVEGVFTWRTFGEEEGSQQ